MDNHIQEQEKQEQVQDQEPIPKDEDQAPVEGEETKEDMPSEDGPSENGEGQEDDFDFSPFLAKLELKVNKEKRKLESIDEAKEYLQKGMDYDRVKTKLKELESDPLREWAYDWAKKNGFEDPNKFLDAVKKEEEERELQKLREANIPEEYAKEMLENKKFREQYEAEQKAKKAQEKQMKEYEEFVKAYPDIKEVPKEVWEIVEEKGKSLTDAYVAYENQLLKDQLRNLQKSEENRKTTTGSLSESPETKEGYFTQEQVRNMSREDVHKNYGKIVESMKQWKSKG